MEKEQFSFEDIFSYANYSATLVEMSDEGLAVSLRLINWAVRKMGLKESKEKIKDFGKKIMELNHPVSLSEGYAELFKGKKISERWKNPMALLIGALKNEEKLGYIKLTITKPETIQFFTFSMNVYKWIINYRLPKQFFKIMAPVDEEVKKKIEEAERFIVKNPVTRKDMKIKMRELFKKLKFSERKMREQEERWAEEEKRISQEKK